MSEDWESVTRIGKSRSGGGNGAQRATVIKGKTALNAAMRTGGVSTEKKVGSANSVSISPSSVLTITCGGCTDLVEQKPRLEGQRDRKVDEATDVVALDTNDRNVAKVVNDEMKKQGLNMASLAQQISQKQDVIKKLLNPNASKPDPLVLKAVENKLGVMLTGSHIGDMTAGAKRKAEREAKKAAEK